MLHIDDQVEVRDTLWRVTRINSAGAERQILQLVPLDKHIPKPITVVSPPEKVLLKRPAELLLGERSIGPFSPWLQAHQWLQLTSFFADNQIYGARFGRVSLEAYQLAPTIRVINQPRPRLLIADDVGLGKTIEAGLCILELIARGRGDRILIVVPPGLIEQWRDDELMEKFNLEFEIIDNAAGLSRAQTSIPAGFSPWDFFPRIITSMEYLKKQDVLSRALKRRWSLIIVDEAHALAESGTPRNPYRTQRSKMAQKLRDASDGLLLLTATPHNGYTHSFRSLIELVEPTAATFGGTKERTHIRIHRARIRRLKSQITCKDEDGNEIKAFPKRNVEPIPVIVDDSEAELFKMVSSYCSKATKNVEGTEDYELVSFAMQIIKKRMLSSRKALQVTINNRLSALSRQNQRDEAPKRVELRELQADLPLQERSAERISQQIIRSAIPKDEKRRRGEIRKVKALFPVSRSGTG